MSVEEEMVRNLKELGDFLEREIANTPDIVPVMERDNHKPTICALLRTIYVKGDDEIKELAIEATVLAKKMTKRLVEYHNERRDDSKKVQ